MTTREDLFMMPWFPRDFFAATRGWSMCAKGVYRDLLDAQWDMGVLPIAPDALKRLIGASDAEWREGWDACESKFPIIGKGRENAKLAYVRGQALDRHRKHATGAKLTNEKRWGQAIDKSTNGSHSDVAVQGRLAISPSESPLKSEILNLRTENLELRGGEDTPARKRAATADWLDVFKLHMPKRAGSHDWRGARKAGNARIAEGHTIEQFIEGADRYGRYLEATGKLNTEFVKMAATFLGPSKFFMELWERPQTRDESRRGKTVTAMQEFISRGKNA